MAIVIKQYQTIIGDILWLTISRYDITHAMSVLSQKTHYCTQRDYDEAKHFLMYILKNPGLPLIFHRESVGRQLVSLQDVLDMPISIMGSSSYRSAGCSTKPRDQRPAFVRTLSIRNTAIYVPFKVSGPTLSACEAENNATVELTSQGSSLYLSCLQLEWLS